MQKQTDLGWLTIKTVSERKATGNHFITFNFLEKPQEKSLLIYYDDCCRFDIAVLIELSCHAIIQSNGLFSGYRKYGGQFK